MNLSEFNQLRLAQQANYLKKKGDYVTTRKDYYYTILLYSVDSFYAELWIDTQQGGDVFTVVAYKDMDNLDFYLEALSLDELLAA